MNRYYFFFFSVLLSFSLISCEDFLDTKNLTKKDSSSFPVTVEDADQALTAIYSRLYCNTVHENPYIIGETASDDRAGGGGANDRKPHAINQLLKTDENMFPNIWSIRYQGIFRANMLLEGLDMVEDWRSESQRTEMTGEILFLRAYFYFDLCRLFGTVPLNTTSEAINKPRATSDELYAFIAQDLKDAISYLPSTKFGASGAPALGRVTKWAAEALMARVFLFYTGYYNKDSMPLTGGGTVTKDNVIAWLEDCIQNSGHSLVPDFRNLWPYSNPYTVADYTWAKNLNLSWVGEEGGNTETIFAMKFSTTTTGMKFNCVGDMGLRAQPDLRRTFPHGRGWGILPVTPNMAEDWLAKEPNDLRFKGSIFHVNDPEEEIEEYTWGSDTQVEECGYWQKKYMPWYYKLENGTVNNFTIPMFGSPASAGWGDHNVCDYVVIRFADVLLMAAELKQDVSYINQVRNRAELPSLAAYSLEALQNERRWELAFEGIRWFDMLRWGVEFTAQAVQKQHGTAVVNRGVNTVMNMPNVGQRVRDTGGFWPIPQAQIDLSGGLLTQTPGWTATDLLWGGY